MAEPPGKPQQAAPLSRLASTSSLRSSSTTGTGTGAGMRDPPHLIRATSAGLARSGDPSLAKTRARNLLRDYYGLPESAKGKEKAAAGSEKSAATAAAASKSVEVDAPGFDAQAAFDVLMKTGTVNELLNRANDLMAEIRELDGERQSLVYNHHHELVGASGTIGKMKASAETLDGSLDSLQSSFSSISSLTASLLAPPALAPPRPPPAAGFDPTIHLPPLLYLPKLLAGLKRADAERLWGEWEPAVRSWEEKGVKGSADIGNECREALKAGRRSSVGNANAEAISPLLEQ